MPYGYNGKILRINLSTGAAIIEQPDDKFFRTYLGGRGIISYYLTKEVEEDIDPLGEENKLIIAASVLTGAPIPGLGRHSVGAKSPLTELYGESEAGGFFGVEMKKAGFEAIIIEGKAASPCYLFVKDGKVQINSAEQLWGKEVADVDEQLKLQHEDKKLGTMIIGKGGENKVLFAGIAADVTHYHGRAGMGAVMGSKNLKAIAVRGTGSLEFANKAKLLEISKWFAQNFKDNSDNYNQNRVGTSLYYFGANEAGSLPTRNFKNGHFDELNFTVDEMHEKLKVKTDGCFACPVRCKQVFKGGEYNIDERYGGPEYETLGAFGSSCGVNSMDAPSKCHELCNKFGLDTVSCGITIAFAIECYENGLISTDDTGGLQLNWGCEEEIIKLVELIANREGFGDVLAQGSRQAAEIIGKGAEKFAMHVKGQEFPLAEPRAKFGVGLAFAVSPTGADHLQHEHDGAFDPKLTGYSHAADDPDYFMRGVFPIGLYKPVPSLSLGPEKVKLFTYLQHFWSMFMCIDLCIFIVQPVRTLKITHLVEIVKAVTGWDYTMWEMMKTGERATTLARVFNLKHGLLPKDDTLPDRMFEELEGGVLSGNKLNKDEFEEAVRLYYEMMGWDKETGIPTKGKLYELDLGWAYSEVAR